ncbi:MAG: hypothetical protein ABI297_01205 [Ginsengibacter sp.]
MRYTIIFSMILALGISGCGKDKFSTKPTLKFTEVNTTELRPGDILQFKMAFTDAEGDISNVITVKKVLLNCTEGFEQDYPVPDFPSQQNQKGDLFVTFGYSNSDAPTPIGKESFQDCPTKVDSAVFKFVLKDKAGNISDTATSPVILIY